MLLRCIGWLCYYIVSVSFRVLRSWLNEENSIISVRNLLQCVLYFCVYLRLTMLQCLKKPDTYLRVFISVYQCLLERKGGCASPHSLSFTICFFFFGTFVDSILANETTYLIELSCFCSSLLGIYLLYAAVYMGDDRSNRLVYWLISVHRRTERDWSFIGILLTQ